MLIPQHQPHTCITVRGTHDDLLNMIETIAMTFSSLAHNTPYIEVKCPETQNRLAWQTRLDIPISDVPCTCGYTDSWMIKYEPRTQN